jgi:CBS domain-containing protein
MSIALPKLVRDIMTRDVITVDEDESLFFLDDIMKKIRFRHVPVVENKMLVGLITERDVLAASVSTLRPEREAEQKELGDRVRVREVMRREVITIPPEAPLVDAVKLMLKHRLGCLPVVDEDQHLLGIVTDADFVKLAFVLLKLQK